MAEPLVWNLGQDFSSLRPQVVFPPACASVPNTVLVLNSAGEMACMNPKFLPEEAKVFPECGPGWVPFRDIRTPGSTWSCVKTGAEPTESSKASLLFPLALAGAAVGGILWWAMRS